METTVRTLAELEARRAEWVKMRASTRSGRRGAITRAIVNLDVQINELRADD